MPNSFASRVDAIRQATSRRLIALLWLLAPAITLGLATLGQPTRQPTLQPTLGQASLAAAAPATALAVLLAIVPTCVWLARRDGLATRLTVAACLASMMSVAAHGLWDTPWERVADIGAVAALALLAAYRDWRAIALGAATILPQMLALDLAMPTAATDTPLLAILLVEAAGLLWICRELDRTAAAGQMLLDEVREAASREERELRKTSEAASDLAGRATEERLALEFEQDVGGLVGAAAGAAEGVRGAVLRISDVTEQTRRQTAAIADASRETSDSAQSVAASVQQLAGSVARVTREIREVSDASFKAMDEAGATNVTVQHLADAAARIGDIIGVIRNIAEQTNLLALNATIESARAGEAGRGFGVVAGAVKALARQTAKATADIEIQVNTIRAEMTRAMTAIDGIAATVAHLGGITVSVAAAMDEQTSVTQEIADSALRAAASTEAVVETLRGLTEGATRADAAAREGLRDADRLARECESVEAAVHGFVQALMVA